MISSLPSRGALALASFALSAACGGPPEGGPADLVARGGVIHTSDAGRPVAEAFAVQGGRFVFVGDASGIESWIGEATEVIELDGRAAIPGLIDGHLHLESGISLVRGVDLTGIADRGEWTRRIAARAAELGPGAWIVGGRWDHTLSGGEFPSVEDLDPVTPDNPVALSDIDGHTTWVNSLALEIASVGAATPDPRAAGSSATRPAIPPESCSRRRARWCATTFRRSTPNRNERPCARPSRLPRDSDSPESTPWRGWIGFRSTSSSRQPASCRSGSGTEWSAQRTKPENSLQFAMTREALWPP